MKSTTAIMALAAAVNASPLTKREDNKVPDVWEHKDTLCEGWVLTTPEEADTLWTMKTKAGDHLDTFLRGHDNTKTTGSSTSEDRVFGGTDGKSGAAGCSVLDNDCSPMNNRSARSSTRSTAPMTPLARRRTGYSRLLRACTPSSKRSRRRLLRRPIISGLRIDQMVTDFGGNEDDTGGYWSSGWLRLVHRRCSQWTLCKPRLRSRSLPLCGIFFALGNLKQEEIDQGSISAGLADLFEATVDRLDETMRIVMGGGTEDQYNALKTSNPDPYKLPIANFFNGGFFFLTITLRAVQLALNSVYGNIQPKVANNVMKAAQFSSSLISAVKVVKTAVMLPVVSGWLFERVKSTVSTSCDMILSPTMLETGLKFLARL